MKTAKCRKYTEHAFLLYKNREYILVCNHIWTQEMNKSSYLNGQERKLPVTKLETSLSNLYCYTGLLSEACEFITHVKQSISTTTTNNDNYNEKFEMLANKGLIRGKCATTEGGASELSNRRHKDSLLLLLQGDKVKPCTDHLPQKSFLHTLSH